MKFTSTMSIIQTKSKSSGFYRILERMISGRILIFYKDLRGLFQRSGCCVRKNLVRFLIRPGMGRSSLEGETTTGTVSRSRTAPLMCPLTCLHIPRQCEPEKHLRFCARSQSSPRERRTFASGQGRLPQSSLYRKNTKG